LTGAAIAAPVSFRPTLGIGWRLEKKSGPGVAPIAGPAVVAALAV
jgi:hypothetical protein